MNFTKPTIYNISAFDKNIYDKEGILPTIQVAFTQLESLPSTINAIMNVYENNTGNNIIVSSTGTNVALTFYSGDNNLAVYTTNISKTLLDNMINGNSYYMTISVTNEDNTILTSNGTVFYCYTQPTIIIETPPNIVSQSSYKVQFSYEQIEGEILDSYQCSLFGSYKDDSDFSLIETSGKLYDTNYSYTFNNLINNNYYYIAIEGTTIERTEITNNTENNKFKVQYTEIVGSSYLELKNNCDDGSIEISTKFNAIQGESNKETSNGEIDLKDEGDKAEWATGLDIDEQNLDIRLWLKNSNGNDSEIANLKDSNNEYPYISIVDKTDINSFNEDEVVGIEEYGYRNLFYSTIYNRYFCTYIRDDGRGSIASTSADEYKWEYYDIGYKAPSGGWVFREANNNLFIIKGTGDGRIYVYNENTDNFVLIQIIGSMEFVDLIYYKNKYLVYSYDTVFVYNDILNKEEYSQRYNIGYHLQEAVSIGDLVIACVTDTKSGKTKSLAYSSSGYDSFIKLFYEDNGIKKEIELEYLGGYNKQRLFYHNGLCLYYDRNYIYYFKEIKDIKTKENNDKTNVSYMGNSYIPLKKYMYSLKFYYDPKEESGKYDLYYSYDGLEWKKIKSIAPDYFPNDNLREAIPIVDKAIYFGKVDLQTAQYGMIKSPLTYSNSQFQLDYVTKERMTSILSNSLTDVYFNSNLFIGLKLTFNSNNNLDTTNSTIVLENKGE